jgi:hypothetical protein
METSMCRKNPCETYVLGIGTLENGDENNVLVVLHRANTYL